MEAPSPSSSSFVSKARTAFHSAAAKAERVLSDFKSDRDLDKQSPRDLVKFAEDESPNDGGESKFTYEQLRWKPSPIGTKQDWQDRLRSIGIGRKGVEDTDRAENSNMAALFYDENYYLLNMKNDLEAKAVEAIPSVEVLNAAKGFIAPLSSVKQLAVAIEAGKKFKSMKEFLASFGGSSPGRERGLTLSAVKSLVLRDKDEKLSSEFGSNEKVLSLIQALFDSDGNFLKRMICSSSKTATIISFPRDIHGSPPDCLIVKLAEVIGSFKNIRKMALFWRRVVAELRRLWSEEKFISGIPLDGIPDLNSCLLYQQLQVINCCLSRKRRRDSATHSLDIVLKESNNSKVGELVDGDRFSANATILYARTNSGKHVVRLGADRPFSDLLMLETGEPVYSPVTQEGPLLTEDLIKETEEFVLRTGSVGAGCSQLLSDMQAFKAANPGCILEDFVRWHSPPDWTEAETADDAKDSSEDGDVSSTRGQLSSRMLKEGNLWREFWETSKPVPAVKQAPLFDEDLAVEGILDILEEIPPSELFSQLFISLLGLGFVIAETSLPANSDLSKLFHECKEYATTMCQSSFWTEKIDDLCHVYDTVERILRNPDEVLKTMKDGLSPVGEPKRLFKRLNLNFGGKDRNFKKSPPKEHNSQPFSNFFDGKSSLFSRRMPLPKPGITAAVEKPSLVENDWTVV